MGTHCESDRRLGKLLIIFKSLEFFNAITLVERKIVLFIPKPTSTCIQKTSIGP